MKLIIVNLALTIFLLIVGGEILLRYSNPFHLQTRVTSHYSPLKDKDQSYSFLVRNAFITQEKADPYIKITRSSKGLRGKEYDPSIHNHKVIFIGGSTTECITLSDGTTWIDRIEEGLEKDKDFNSSDIWFANAGVGGQSSFGHLEFIKRHYLKENPQFFIFLIGANELNRFYLDDDFRAKKNFGRKEDDEYQVINKTRSLPLPKEASFFWSFVHHYKQDSALLYNLSELRNRQLTKRLVNSYKHNFNLKDLEHRELQTLANMNYEFEVDLLKLKKGKLKENLISDELKAQEQFQTRVRKNIKEIISLSKANNILPIFITQPALYGEGVDPITNVNLETMILQSGNVNFGQGLTGKEMWALLEAYNDILREITKEQNVPLIDLARKLPKNSNYYYDYIHFSKAGAQEVAKILTPDIKKYLKRNLKK